MSVRESFNRCRSVAFGGAALLAMAGVAGEVNRIGLGANLFLPAADGAELFLSTELFVPAADDTGPELLLSATLRQWGLSELFQSSAGIPGRIFLQSLLVRLVRLALLFCGSVAVVGHVVAVVVCGLVGLARLGLGWGRLGLGRLGPRLLELRLPWRLCARRILRPAAGAAVGVVAGVAAAVMAVAAGTASDGRSIRE